MAQDLGSKIKEQEVWEGISILQQVVGPRMLKLVFKDDGSMTRLEPTACQDAI